MSKGQGYNFHGEKAQQLLARMRELRREKAARKAPVAPVKKDQQP